MVAESVEYMEFANTLREYRAQARMSQTELARRSGLDHSYVSRLESGYRTPTRDAVIKLAKAMELSPEKRDRLLASAGFMPMQIQCVLQEESVASDLWQFLLDPTFSEETKDEVRDVVSSLLSLARLTAPNSIQTDELAAD